MFSLGSSAGRKSRGRKSGGWDWRSAFVGALVTAFSLGLIVLIWRRPSPPPVVVHPPPSPQVPTPVTTAPEAMLVFVSGAVQAPGVYSLEPGARVADALGAAGGLRGDANAVAVNQAAPLHDGDQVHVPAQAEAPAEPPAGVSGAPPATESAMDGALGGPVNINTATAAELETLPGIGPARAEDIIAHRPYAAVDDLLRVPGIGSATLEELRPLIEVE